MGNAVAAPGISVNDVCEQLKTGSLEIVSTNGALAIHEELTHKAALLSDDTLVVAADSIGDPLLLDYTNRLDRAGVAHELEIVQLSDISRMREAWSASGGNMNQADVAERQYEMVRLIEAAVRLGGSDLHLVSEGDDDGQICWIYVRVHGEKRLFKQVSGFDGVALMRAAYQTMCDTGQQTFRDHEPQDARLKADYVKRLGLFGARLATRPRSPGIMMILRLLYDNMGDAGLESLGYPYLQQEQIRRFTHLPHGIVIFTGPTGSGKSMAMKASLQERIDFFDHSIHVVTIEDPPEYPIRGANQTALSHHRDWAADIANCLRLDPDTLMVGEIRDLASAIAGFRAAMTGHGIWTTLHTTDATSAIDRLYDLGIMRSLLTNPALMRGVVSQNLVQQLCPHCAVTRYEVDIPNDMQERLERVGVLEHARFRNPDGCLRCDHQGILGRLPVAEILQPTMPFFDTYMREGIAAARRLWLTELGGRSKTSWLIELVREGIVDPFNGEREVGPLDDDLLTIGTVDLEKAS